MFTVIMTIFNTCVADGNFYFLLSMHGKESIVSMPPESKNHIFIDWSLYELVVEVISN